jgi:hypothetical protein
MDMQNRSWRFDLNLGGPANSAISRLQPALSLYFSLKASISSASATKLGLLSSLKPGSVDYRATINPKKIALFPVLYSTHILEANGGSIAAAKWRWLFLQASGTLINLTGRTDCDIETLLNQCAQAAAN